jgi:hypothetical protein
MERHYVVCYRSRPGKLGHVHHVATGSTPAALSAAYTYAQTLLANGAEWVAISRGTVPLKIYRP